MAEDACRIDVWLWRARLFKTRALSARMVEEGRIRLERQGVSTRLDKPSRSVKIGDALVFSIGGRLTCVLVAAFGDRRGPPTEARLLYEARPESPTAPPLTSGPRA